MLLVLLVPIDVPQNAANVMMRSNKIYIAEASKHSKTKKFLIKSFHARI